MKIYTKTGDKGKTSLFDGTRVKKDNIRVDTYGTVDELNSWLGIVVAEISNEKLKIKDQKYLLKRIPLQDIVIIKNELMQIQNDLFDIGAILANPNKEFGEKEQQYFQKRVSAFENLIDAMTKKLPELANFILPGGGETGAFLQFARTICRRTERRIISLSREVTVSNEIIIYFNRLSDVLFTMSRWVNWKEGETEIAWKKSL